MSQSSRQTETIFCHAPLNYVDADGALPRQVPIRNGRIQAPGPWQVHGFERMDHESAVTNWLDPEEVATVHYPEIEAFAQQLTGCTHALVAGHISRNPEQAAVHQDLAPIQFVHSDFADSYGGLLRRTFGEERNPGSGQALRRAGITAEQAAAAARILVLQFWRNVGERRMDLPIAFCDATTVPRDHLQAFPVTNYADGGGPTFDTLGIHYPGTPDQHDWYTYPELQDKEVIAFRTYDTEAAARGEPYWTPHSAFPDPAVEPGKPSRMSIELRATCLFFEAT
jgi:hypothetical protein